MSKKLIAKVGIAVCGIAGLAYLGKKLFDHTCIVCVHDDDANDEDNEEFTADACPENSECECKCEACEACDCTPENEAIFDENDGVPF